LAENDFFSFGSPKMAQTLWDDAVTQAISFNTVNITDFSARVATIDLVCPMLDTGNSDMQQQCEIYVNEKTRLTAEITKLTTANTALNSRLYASLTANDQATVNYFFALLPQYQFTRLAAEYRVTLLTLDTRFNNAIQSTTPPNSVSDEVKQSLYERLFTELRNATD